MYDDQMFYIGKGPSGLQELLQIVVEITADMQKEGIIRNKFGREIPVIFADFEFTWYMVKATKQANPNGEADTYIQDCIDNGWIMAEQLQ